MNKKRLEVKVGAFVLVGLVLLGLLLLQFSKGTSLFHPTYRILVRSTNVAGLREKAAVLMSGVQVGTVSSIALAPEGKHVTITLKIYSQFKVHKDARFLLQQSGFLGDQYIAIVPTENKGEPFRDLETAEAEPPFNLQEVAKSASGIVQSVEDMTKKLNGAIVQIQQHLLNEQTLTNLSVAVFNLRTVSERALSTVDNLNAAVLSNSPAFKESSSNLMVFSRQINEFAGSLKGVLATNTPGLNATVQNIEQSSETLKLVMNDMKAGKGLAGNVLRNDELAQSVTDLANNLNITSSNLNRLGLWGVLWKKKTPKTVAPSTHEQQLHSPKVSGE